MALSFGTVKGQAQSNSYDVYDFKAQGDHKVRLFGPIVPRYLYWVKTQRFPKGFPLQCLQYDRQKQSFSTGQRDPVKAMYPDLNCSWGYSMLCVHQGKIKTFNFKKKLFGQIVQTAKDLGDPADLENGWDLCFSKKKTGPLPINVQYNVQALKCSAAKGPVSDQVRQLIKSAKPISQVFKRLTSDQQQQLLKKIHQPKDQQKQSVDQELNQQFDIQG